MCDNKNEVSRDCCCGKIQNATGTAAAGPSCFAQTRTSRVLNHLTSDYVAETASTATQQGSTAVRSPCYDGRNTSRALLAIAFSYADHYEGDTPSSPPRPQSA